MLNILENNCDKYNICGKCETLVVRKYKKINIKNVQGKKVIEEVVNNDKDVGQLRKCLCGYRFCRYCEENMAEGEH